MSKKIYLIYPDVSTSFIPNVHHGLAQIISVLKANGQEVSLHHVISNLKKKNIISRLDEEKPDYIGFTTMTNQMQYVKTWSKWIKEVKDIPIICGGVHATLNPFDVINMNSVDMVCIGEGAYPILDVMKDESQFIKNVWFKKQRNDLRPLIDDLDKLPFPDYDLFDMNNMLKNRNGEFAVIASVGCPYDCANCCNHALKEAQSGLGRYFRYRSVNNVLSMLEYYIGRYPI